MSVSASRGSVGTAATALYEIAAAPKPVAAGVRGTDVYLRVAAGTATLGGGSTVTPTTGYNLVAGEPIRVNLDPGESIWGIRAAAGTTTVHILASNFD